MFDVTLYRTIMDIMFQYFINYPLDIFNDLLLKSRASHMWLESSHCVQQVTLVARGIQWLRKALMAKEGFINLIEKSD